MRWEWYVTVGCVEHCRWPAWPRRHAHVGKDSRPESGHPHSPQGEDDELNGKGKGDVLPDDMPRAPPQTDSLSDLRRLVGLDDDIGRLDGGVAPQPTHGNAHVSESQHRGVVHAVADECCAPPLVLQGLQVLDFPFGKKVSPCPVDAEAAGHTGDNTLPVARKHLDVAYAQGP